MPELLLLTCFHPFCLKISHFCCLFPNTYLEKHHLPGVWNLPHKFHLGFISFFMSSTLSCRHPHLFDPRSPLLILCLNLPDCQMVCNSSDTPVVCMNGKIQFGNACIMKVAACQHNLQVKNVTDGFCQTGSEPTGNEGTGDKKEVSKPEVDECNVIRGCLVTNNPVCGSNKITYQVW